MLDFSANEEEKKKARQRESLVSPGGQHFPQVVTRAIHQLYDKNDTPLMYDFGVMYSKFLIPGGKTPQGKAISTKAAQDHNEALRRKFRDEHKLLLNDPDKFAAYTRFEFVDFDEDENYSTGQKEAMIFKEVVMQLLRFVTNDKNLESMDIPLEAVASIRSFLKMANMAAGLARNG